MYKGNEIFYRNQRKEEKEKEKKLVPSVSRKTQKKVML